MFFQLLGLSRLSIVATLCDGELRVSDVVDATRLTQPNVSMHLACLWECGLRARSAVAR